MRKSFSLTEVTDQSSRHFLSLLVVDVQLLSRVQLFAAPWTTALQAPLSSTVSWNLPKLICWVSDAIQPSHPLLPPSPFVYSLSQHQGLFLSQYSLSKTMLVFFYHFCESRLVFSCQAALDLLAVRDLLNILAHFFLGANSAQPSECC